MKILATLLLIGSLQAQPLRVLLVTGGHDHDPSFYSIFEGDNTFRTNIRPHPTAFSGDFRRNTDVLVLYDMIKTGLPENKRAHLREYLESGKGMVILHHACECGWVIVAQEAQELAAVSEGQDFAVEVRIGGGQVELHDW